MPAKRTSRPKGLTKTLIREVAREAIEQINENPMYANLYGSMKVDFLLSRACETLQVGLGVEGDLTLDQIDETIRFLVLAKAKKVNNLESGIK